MAKELGSTDHKLDVDSLLVELATDASTDAQALNLARVLTCLSFWSMGDLDVAKKEADLKLWFASAKAFLEANKAQPLLKRLTALVTACVSKEIPGQDHEELFAQASEYLTIFDPKMEKDHTIKTFTLNAVRKNAQFFRTGSMTSYNWISTNATKISNSLGAEVLDEALPSQLTDAHKLIDTIEALTGRRDIKLTEDEKEKFRKDNPNEYATILQARRNIVQVSKQFIRMHVRKTGKLVKYSTMLADLRDHYIFHDYPKTEGWDGYIDEDGALYTLAKKKIQGKPGFLIQGNPDYNPKTDDTYVFTVITSTGATQYFYTNEAKKGWRDERFEAVDNFAPMIEEVREKWLRDINANSKHKVLVLAIICELLYWASARIGGIKNNVKGNQTFGISTLKGKHIVMKGNTLVLDYIGKTGVHQRHELVPKLPQQHVLVKRVLKWTEAAGDDNYIFDLVEGNHATPPTNAVINNYFRAKGAPQDVTVHKLRHTRATAIMDKQFRDPDKCPFFKYTGDKRKVVKTSVPDQSQAEAKYKEMATQVGKELGHTAGQTVTPSTAINAYINPTTTTTFFEDLKLRLPSWASKFAGD